VEEKANLNEETDGTGPEDVPANDEQEANDLYPDLATVAIDCSARWSEGKCCGTFASSEESSQEAPNYATNQVSMLAVQYQ